MESRNYRSRKPKSKFPYGAKVAVIDLLLAGIFLCVFALFHHVLPTSKGGPIGTTKPVSSPSAQVSSEASPGTSSDPGETSSQQPQSSESASADPTSWREKFKEHFSGDVVQTDTSYKSPNISVELETVSENGMTYYVADIYVADISYFKTAFAEGEYGKGIRAMTLDMAKENNAIVAISGDYYGNRDDGTVIRNGNIYREESYAGDSCVLYYDGTMEAYFADEFDVETAKANGAYQTWCFGPKLLDNGQPMEEFNSEVSRKNPRSAIGYFEPGHYCFVLVDGRQEGYSDGASLAELSQIFYDLGCKDAYNLDGGQTAAMAFGDSLASRPVDGGRRVSDILYISEEGAES